MPPPAGSPRSATPSGARGRPPSQPVLAPLYGAGFVTAFGSHAVAATAGAGVPEGAGGALLRLGLLVAVYDLAEVLLKPVFGALSDRVGPKPVVIWGLVVFAAVSLVGAAIPGAIALIGVRFGQGAAASAFSPAASAAVARLSSPAVRGRYFGRYGSWKSLGYAAGPIVGAVLAGIGGLSLLQLVLAGIATIVAVWVGRDLPVIRPIPKARATVLDTLQQATTWTFLQPVVVLAATAGSLVVAVAFLPAMAARSGAGLVESAAVAPVIALASTVTQPIAGRLLDQGRLTFRRAAPFALLLCSAGVTVAAFAPSVVTVLLAAVLIGIGVGTGTPVAYAALAGRTHPNALGRTMGSAELGRELGDAGAPALVGLVSAAGGLGLGLAVLAVGLFASTVVAALRPARAVADAQQPDPAT